MPVSSSAAVVTPSRAAAALDKGQCEEIVRGESGDGGRAKAAAGSGGLGRRWAIQYHYITAAWLRGYNWSGRESDLMMQLSNRDFDSCSAQRRRA